MVPSSVLGFPRIGANGEVKKAVEVNWAGKLSAEELIKAASDVKKSSWKVLGSLPLDAFFAMGRGRQAGGVDIPACEMKKWPVFDSYYHFVVPELSEETDFKLLYNKVLAEYKEAKEAGVVTRPVILGPISYLILARVAKEASATFQPISLLSKILPVYKQLQSELKAAGVESVQIKPILVLDKGAELDKQYAFAYAELVPVAPKIMLTTYFNRLESNINFIAKLPAAGLHIDLVRAPQQLGEVITAIKSTPIVLSLGVVSGRNIWKADIAAAIKFAQTAIAALDADCVIVATPSSLLHIPVTLASEKKLTEQQRDWVSFALEKASEVATIAAVLSGSQDPKVSAALEANEVSIAKRRQFESTSDDAVRKRVAAITPGTYDRKSPFATLKEVQAKHLNLPKFPTTTIGSFPQTKEISESDEFTKKKIEMVVKFQEKVGLDLLVHGEHECNDMPHCFSNSYVRPLIIVSDVSRPKPMTVKWSSYAPSVSTKPMKGILSGPVTILNWSFLRDDVPRKLQSQQLALALRDEIIDLEKAGISAIQVDEPAIREGVSVFLPEGATSVMSWLNRDHETSLGRDDIDCDYSTIDRYTSLRDHAHHMRRFSEAASSFSLDTRSAGTTGNAVASWRQARHSRVPQGLHFRRVLLPRA
ncbi:hypothetical protein EV424DRAFT_1570825 [Suillus variegatus]|nr:hypothetical protein EV424DRAFT_1570825 [Suillus variegatus]